MPRNGDGSGDNGPIDGHEIVHGAEGDDSLQHTKKIAPMPNVEEGDALPGIPASSAPTNSDNNTHKKRDQPHDGLPTNNLEQKFTKLDEDEVNISTAPTKEQERDARAQRRADAVGESRGKGDDEVKRFGGHADVEELHGKARLEGGSGGEDGKGARDEEGGKDV